MTTKVASSNSNAKEMTIDKVYFNKKHEAIFTCPNCKLARLINVKKFKENNDIVGVKCSCDCIYYINELLPESRKFQRKQANLPGSFLQTTTDMNHFMNVTDLSFSGIKFHTEKEHNLEIGEIIGVRFVLDDGNGTEIRRKVAVRRINGRNIGAEFCDTQCFDMELSYYLMVP